jgi:hypothetical protein
VKSADLLEVFRRLGEARKPLLDERAHEVFEFQQEPLFLQSVPRSGIDT